MKEKPRQVLLGSGGKCVLKRILSGKVVILSWYLVCY